MFDLPPIEGVWYGADKVAHFLVPLTLTGWVLVFNPRLYAWGVILGVLGGMLWEVSNQFVVFDGSLGVSLLDAMAFLFGGLVAGVLALIAWRKK